MTDWEREQSLSYSLVGGGLNQTAAPITNTDSAANAIQNPPWLTKACIVSIS